MVKYICPGTKKYTRASKPKSLPRKSKSGSRRGCGKRKGHPANMFILYFLHTWRTNGGNMYCVAKECGQKWKTLPAAEKEKYKQQYCSRCKSCKSCVQKCNCKKVRKPPGKKC